VKQNVRPLLNWLSASLQFYFRNNIFSIERAYLLKRISKERMNMALKPGPKRIADSTGKPDQRQRDNKSTPGNTPALKPSKSSTPKKK
jgi:hypothetical protein